VKILGIDLIGLLLIMVASLLVYGARWIILKVFQYPEEESMKFIVIAKLVGWLMGILGMLKIMKIL
jgi:hypothetical protein